MWSGSPAAHLVLRGEALGVDPSGEARWLVRVEFTDAHGRPTELVQGGNVDFFASRGNVQWQTRARFGAPSAVVSTIMQGPIAVRARLTSPAGVPDARIVTDTRAWRGARTAAVALGPHLVELGWFPPASGPVRIVRTGPKGARTVLTAPPGSSMLTDAAVRPATVYRYVVSGSGLDVTQYTVAVPPEVALRGNAIAGKGVWLTFSPSLYDPDAYTTIDPSAIVSRAAQAGLRHIELRMAYGPYWEVTPQARPVIDELIDGAAARGIAVVAFVVPRSTAPEDIARSVSAATYATAKGTRVAGLALDLERGEDYFGWGPDAYSALAAYPRFVRAALGSRYPLAAIVEDPYLEHLTNRDYPYASIASSVDELQPMTYWRMSWRVRGTQQGTRRAIEASLAALRDAAGRSVPIALGGQTADLAGYGAPPPDEITAALVAARENHATGVTFFNFGGTSPAQWEAIAHFAW